MKILVSTHAVTRRVGGVFNAVSDLFTNVAFSSIDIEIMSYWDKYVEDDRGRWGNLKLTLYKVYPFLYSRKKRKAVLTSDADIFHVEGIWRYPHLLMEQWKLQVQKPIVCSTHGMLDPYIIKEQGHVKRIISNLFFQKSLESVTCYHALCQKELDDIRAYGLKQPIAIIPNGVNIPIEGEHYEKNDNKKHLLFLGRVHKKKGIDILISAFGKIKQERPDLVKEWIVDVVGWDHENSQASIVRLVEELDLNEQVVFHGGLYGEDKSRMYAICDAYILPSHGEGLPMTILEAWSWKKPVVMTPECHIPEGYEADAAIRIEDNVDSVFDGLTTILEMTEEERSQMGLRGYELVLNSFTWDASAKKMIELYNWLLNKAPKPNFVFE